MAVKYLPSNTSQLHTAPAKTVGKHQNVRQHGDKQTIFVCKSGVSKNTIYEYSRAVLPETPSSNATP